MIQDNDNTESQYAPRSEENVGNARFENAQTDPGSPESRSFDARSESSKKPRGAFSNSSFIPQTSQKKAKHSADEYVERPESLVRTVFFDGQYELYRLIALLLTIIPLGLVSYWRAVVEMEKSWRTVLDYSHGYLVIPLVCCFFWLRMDTYPGTTKRLEWLGLIPMFLAILARSIGSWYYMEAVEQWSFLLWIWGCVWFFYGNRVFLWALPVLIFLAFMFPLPDSVNYKMRDQLQPFAAQFGAFLLQLIGEPAMAVGKTIRHGTQELGVEAACSGLRFIISIAAIALGAVLLLRRSWLQNIIILVSAVPIALFVNASRIAMTGMLLNHAPEFLVRYAGEGKSPSAFADTFSGYVMIVVALLIFALFLFYLGRVFRRVNYQDIESPKEKKATFTHLSSGSNQMQ